MPGVSENPPGSMAQVSERSPKSCICGLQDFRAKAATSGRPEQSAGRTDPHPERRSRPTSPGAPEKNCPVKRDSFFLYPEWKISEIVTHFLEVG